MTITNPPIASIVAGMAAGADSIDDLDVIRHGGMPRLFGGVYAPSTLGSFLRAFTHGRTRQLDAVARRLLVDLAARTPMLAGAAEMTYVDIDSLLRRVYGKRKQGAGFGHTKVGGYPVRLRGLSPLAVTISTPIAAPVIAAIRLRKGSAGSSRGAASLLAEALCLARAAGATGHILMRADSAYYAGAVTAWATCAAITHNLLRAAGSLASRFHTKTRGATLRRHLIAIPARLARPQGQPIQHLPEHWPWEHAFTALHTATIRPPTT